MTLRRKCHSERSEESRIYNVMAAPSLRSGRQKWVWATARKDLTPHKRPHINLIVHEDPGVDGAFPLGDGFP